MSSTGMSGRLFRSPTGPTLPGLGLVCALGWLTLSAGCAVAIPTPRHTPRHLREVNARSMQFMLVGSTTRQEVLLNLGEPDAVVAGPVPGGLSLDDVLSRVGERKLEWEDERYFVYQWLSVRGYWAAAAMYGGTSGHIKKARHHLLVEFDDQGVVKTVLIELPGLGRAKRYGSGSRPWEEPED